MTKPKWNLLPFQFRRNDDGICLVNQGGDFFWTDETGLERILKQELDGEESFWQDLESKHFIARDEYLEIALNLTATKLRSRKAYLDDFTALHMIVLTGRCNCRCHYCHASSSDDSSTGWDMDWKTAKKVTEMIFSSPSPCIKIEFQGGEPVLNWDILCGIVDYAKMINKFAKRHLEFVVATNLTLLDDAKLEYLKKAGVEISTSLDGPKELHDKYRNLRNGKSAYDEFMNRVGKVKELWGQGSLSPLLTITKEHLGKMESVIDEYLSLGVRGIFLRALNPYGMAKKEWDELGYSIEDFVECFKNTLEYILEINKKGTYFPEFYSTLLFRRIMTPFSTGFVDLQSPAGCGTSGVIYDYNGNVYPSDEARMLARVGDEAFCMGNVHRNTYEELFLKSDLPYWIEKTLVESMPGCSTCAWQVYCGSDPVRNYVESGNIVGHKTMSEFCYKHKSIIDHIFHLIRNDPETEEVFWSWVNNRPLARGE